jgi:hypothetical protein
VLVLEPTGLQLPSRPEALPKRFEAGGQKAGPRK